ncbi:FMN-dependent NADH-azoreductase [Bacteroides reticulotermitis]|uniref:FMN-dependent NADH-azoreductase n=2 Tax=Bacteroides reticulotermitis TaxID=1133319 RepID=W4UVJ1_9BACE|nr:FMN-dependent NADH-azoreductase [Bacteroides reticulotermitis]GAE84946.1 FMN-dependent NADH-azoreductase [Bacteroides reticulotermitis JCM 10512]
MVQDPLPHFGLRHIKSFTTPQGEHSAELATIYQLAEETLDKLFAADIIVIGVPMYNLGIPSTLKTWIDNVTRAGRTFRYTEKGPEGLVKGKKAYLAIATGSIFSDDQLRSPLDFTEPYLRAALDLIGITDVTTFRVEDLCISGIKKNALNKTVEIANEQI